MCLIISYSTSEMRKEVKDAIQGRLELEEMKKIMTSMEADKKI